MTSLDREITSGGIPAPHTSRVLVVEDEGLIAQDIASRLRSLGHPVVATAASAEEALEHAGEADIVLMDIRIQGDRDGIETAELIRKRFQIPVVFLTAHADPATLERAKSTQPFGYIVKPVGPAALESALTMAQHNHRIERQLSEREAWLAASIAATSDAFLVADYDGRIRLMNRAAELLTGWTSGEAAQNRLDTVARLVDSSGEDFGDPVPLAVLAAAPVPIGDGLKLVRRDGLALDIEGAIAPVVSGGETLGVVLSLRDVTARLWEQRQLKTAQRMEAASRMAGRISGEFKGLAESIRISAAQLERQFENHPPVQSALYDIGETAASIGRTSHQLSEFAAGNLKHPEETSLNGALRRLAPLQEATAGRQVHTTIKLGNDTSGKGHVWADPLQLEQVILNLVLHASQRLAIEATGTKSEKPTIRLRTGWAQIPRNGKLLDCAALTIAYTAEEPHVDLLFEPAPELEESASSGLAMALSHSIVTEHGGHLVANSSDGLTTIELLLPTMETESQPLARLSAASARVADTPSTGVLYIDHQARVREQLHRFFEARGFHFIEATSAEEAATLLSLHEGGIDVVIGDGDTASRALELYSSTAGEQDTLPLPVPLRAVDVPTSERGEIQRPFTQQQLSDRVAQLAAVQQSVNSKSTAAVAGASSDSAGHASYGQFRRLVAGRIPVPAGPSQVQARPSRSK